MHEYKIEWSYILQQDGSMYGKRYIFSYFRPSGTSPFSHTRIEILFKLMLKMYLGKKKVIG